MTVQISVCQECGKEDITGYVACVKRQLCPDCGAKYIPRETFDPFFPFHLRIALMEIQAREAEKQFNDPRLDGYLGD